MLYDPVNDVEYEGWYDMIEDFGFDSEISVLYDKYSQPNKIAPEIIRQLRNRCEDEIPNWSAVNPDGSEVYPYRYIRIVGIASEKSPYKDGKQVYSGEDLTFLLHLGGPKAGLATSLAEEKDENGNPTVGRHATWYFLVHDYGFVVSCVSKEQAEEYEKLHHPKLFA